MNEREFLNKVRALQESNTKIEEVSVDKIKQILSENENETYTEIDIDTESEDIETVTPEEQREEENKFKDIVSKLCEFNKIKIHEQNVEWSGYLIREKIEWVFSLDEVVGCYIKTGRGEETDFFQLKDESLVVLKKLRGYYDVWSDEWASRLTGASGSGENEF
jgi:hypothetical protein